jgi:hypothetical protein
MCIVVMSGWSKLTPETHAELQTRSCPCLYQRTDARAGSSRQTRQDDVCLPIVETAIKEGTSNLCTCRVKSGALSRLVSFRSFTITFLSLQCTVCKGTSSLYNNLIVARGSFCTAPA